MPFNMIVETTERSVNVEAVRGCHHAEINSSSSNSTPRTAGTSSEASTPASQHAPDLGSMRIKTCTTASTSINPDEHPVMTASSLSIKTRETTTTLRHSMELLEKSLDYTTPASTPTKHDCMQLEADLHAAFVTYNDVVLPSIETLIEALSRGISVIASLPTTEYQYHESGQHRTEDSSAVIRNHSQRRILKSTTTSSTVQATKPLSLLVDNVKPSASPVKKRKAELMEASTAPYMAALDAGDEEFMTLPMIIEANKVRRGTSPIPSPTAASGTTCIPTRSPRATIESSAASASSSPKKFRKVFNASPRRGQTSHGVWSTEECELFEDALKLHGHDWNNVAKFVGTRNITQTRSHAQKYFRTKSKQAGRQAAQAAKAAGLGDEQIALAYEAAVTAMNLSTAADAGAQANTSFTPGHGGESDAMFINV